MQMIGHDYELMQDVLFLLAVVLQHIHHQFSWFSVAEQGCALPRHSGNEECAIKGHFREMLGVQRRCVCDARPFGL